MHQSHGGTDSELENRIDDVLNKSRQAADVTANNPDAGRG